VNGPGGNHPGAGEPWYRRPLSGDETAAARPGAIPRRAAPPRRQPPPTPRPPARRQPPSAHRPPPPSATPWYLRPVRPAAPNPPAPPPATANQLVSDPVWSKRFIRRLLIGAGIVAVVVEAAVLLGGVLKLGGTGGRVFDVRKVQVGVLQTLSDPASGYGANTVTDVSCNNGRNPSADKGTTFTCDVTVNGAQRHVTVVVSDDKGTYEIDRPR
jgi:hypothetical protein